ncbi:MAG: hypothetical protein GSR84_01935 [Desulfurococcales archaeon]|nr:hypothetical protein [Desulfurococcales archaeon]
MKHARRASLATFTLVLLLLAITPSSAGDTSTNTGANGIEILQRHTNTTTSQAPQPPENPPCENFIDLSTGTGDPLVAQPPGTPSDPVGDWPDWGLINSSSSTPLQQPVAVQPYPGWYNGGPVAWGNASWITVYASNGMPSRLEGQGDFDTWYAINFTLECPGTLELWFTADDEITLYLNGKYLANHSDLATLGYVNATLQPGSYTLVAHVDDTHRVVTGFLVYGWVCTYCGECPNQTVTTTTTTTVTTTTTETTTTTIVKTETIEKTKTVTETVTTTTTVTQGNCCCCFACQPYTPPPNTPGTTTTKTPTKTITETTAKLAGEEGSITAILRSGAQSLAAALLAAVLVYVLLGRK